MKRSTLLVIFLGLVAGRAAMAQTICAGAEGSSQACTLACSGARINDEVVVGSNQGTFNVGNGNQGDGNDGFNNQGNFNIGSGNVGNCNLASGGNGGTCDPGNNNGQIVLRFCKVYPTNNRCQPSGYLPEFSDALKAQLPAVVASCNGVVVPPTASPPAATPPTATPPTATPPTATPPTAMPPTAPTPGSPVVPSPPVPGSPLAPGSGFPFVSDSTADLNTLFGLLAEHIQQERALGRKLLL